MYIYSEREKTGRDREDCSMALSACASLQGSPLSILSKRNSANSWRTSPAAMK